MPGQNIKRIFTLAKGFRGRSKNCTTIARNAVERSMRHAMVNRKVKQRNFRASWIKTINAGFRDLGCTYSFGMYAMRYQNVELNRRVLSQLAISEPLSFRAVAQHIVKSTINDPKNPHEFPTFTDMRDTGILATNFITQSYAKGKTPFKPKPRRKVANFY